MQTILQILKMAGGWHPGLYLKIDTPPYMELVIEAMDESGPRGLPALSVAHYGEQNGDAMRDPEMCFELEADGELSPYYYRNDYVGVEPLHPGRLSPYPPHPVHPACVLRQGLGPQHPEPGLRASISPDRAHSRLT